VLILAAFAIYVIIARRVFITRSFTLTGEKARVFGFLLLILVFPATLLIHAGMRAFLPSEVLAHPVFGRLIGIGVLGLFALALAYAFRDK
jgi:hypothetical protein